ncbi:MAG TPA: IS3 family transposase [Solirubrobacterales bacterium]|nr:IS3 family transposase [Solirubrobacterales bacterium]
MPRQRKYPEELLDRGARLVFESGRPVTHVARDLGIPSETLRKWVRQAEADAGKRKELLSSEERQELGRLRGEVRELRRANEILKSASGFFRGRARPTPTEVSSFIEEHRERFGVEPICATLEVSASAYYERAKGRRSARAIEDERLLTRIREIHERNYCAYGYRRMWIALQREGEGVGRGRVQRLMKGAGIQGAKRRGKAWRTTKPDPLAHRRPDLVERDFSAEAPNRLWVGDFTYLRSWEGALFFSFVIDAFSRKIVGWQLAPHMRTDLVLDALRMALAQREPGADIELVHHSDRGSQYTSIDYTQTLDDHGVLASVGSVGDAYDNAMAESFVDSFKTELIADRSWRPRTQLELAVVEYIAWFNNDRLHESLGDLPPAEFEDLYVAQEVQLSNLS